MIAADLETARAFVACKAWVFLPGMSVVPRDGLGMCDVPDRVEAMDGENTIVTPTGSRISANRRVPNLDDALTRAGLLVVVRRAHDDPSIGITRAGDEWAVTRGRMTIPGQLPAIQVTSWVGNDEPAALLRALQAAPEKT